MIVRQADEKDAKQFLELLCEIDASNNMLFNPGERKTTVEQQRKIIQDFKNDPRSAFLVDENEGDLIGYIGLVAGNLQRISHIGRIVIGVSKKVIERNTAAINLYEKVGFIKEGKRIESLIIDDKFVDEWSMYKKV